VEASSLAPWEPVLHPVALKGPTEIPKPSRVVQPSARRETDRMDWYGIRQSGEVAALGVRHLWMWSAVDVILA